MRIRLVAKTSETSDGFVSGFFFAKPTAWANGFPVARENVRLRYRTTKKINCQ